MATYSVEYTLPGERGKIHKASFSSSEARAKKIVDVKKRGGNIKSVSSHS